MTIQPITPEQAELSLEVLAGPRGSVHDDWPSIEYVVELIRRRQVIWRGEFRLGVGHVKWPKKFEAYPLGMTKDQIYCLNTIRMNPGAQIKDKQLWADTAARLAKAQKVQPKLDDVAHSLLSDGSAFFDGETFDGWCAKVGALTSDMTPTAGRAEATYRTCDEIGRKLAQHLSRDELAGLREWASSY